MKILTKSGPIIFGAGIALLGVVAFAFRTLIPGLQPAWSAQEVGSIWIYLNGLFLLGAGTALLVRPVVHLAAFALSLFFAGWALLFHFPAIVGNPGDASAWVAGVETVAIAGIAWTLMVRRFADDEKRGATSLPGVAAGRLGFGIALIVFGIVHLIHRDLIASMIPGWLPARNLWPWLTGAANIAAGITILTGFKGHFGAAGIGLVYASWILIIHPARVTADVTSAFEWSFLVTAIILTGAAWIVARDLEPERTEKPKAK